MLGNEIRKIMYIIIIIMAMFSSSGVRIIENCRIKRVLTSGDSVSSVDTDNGYIQCNIFVNCTGMVRERRRLVGRNWFYRDHGVIIIIVLSQSCYCHRGVIVIRALLLSL